ncbi:MAG: ATP-binding cassette domain-containing protein [Bacteroidales bacterium]|nr:ATP-binding cassette domain-containing protein [Bacteroidales bacterium]
MLKVEGLSKKFKEFAICDITFEVNKGDYFMLLGPSGAGKSMILEIIAGIVKLDNGQIWINGNDVTKASIGKRSVGLVFQDLAVFPNMSVSQNIGYPLRRKGIKKIDEQKKVFEIAEKLSISNLLDRNPALLSGGELQRVALARTLAVEPKVLLLDEPLSSVDVRLRSGLMALLRSLNREGQTILHVTHDYDEAISLGSHVAVVNSGTIVQTGTPVDVFRNPASEFVANFSGIKNFFQGSISDKTEHGLKGFSINGLKVWFYADEIESNGFICFPENAVSVSIDKPENSALNTFQGTIVDIFPQKHGFEVWVDIGVRVAALVTWESVEKLGLKTDKKVWISVKANSVRFIPKV